MTSRETFDSLLARWAELSDLGKASALLSWDQETKMPPGGAEARGKQLATLAGLHHEQLVAPEVGDWISACIADEGEFDEVERAALREAAHEHTMATSLPGDLVREEAELQS